MKAIAVTRTYRAEVLEDSVLRIIAYRIVDEEWSTHSFRRTPGLLDRMMAYATNMITLKTGSGLKEGYVYVEVEVPGLRVFRGEGGLSSVDTILYPILQPLNKIVLLRRENEALKPIHELKVRGEYWIYDTRIELKKNIEYDALLIVTSEDTRIVFRDELKLSTIKPAGKKRKRRKKRKKRTKRKTRKKKTKTRRKTARRKKKRRRSKRK